MRKIIGNLLRCGLIMLVGLQILPLRASNQPEQASQEIARADTGTPNATEMNTAGSASPATMASTIEAMKEQIEIQRRQIEKLQTTLEQQQMEFNKAMGTVAASSSAVQASTETSVQTRQEEAQYNLQASNVSPSASQSAPDPKQNANTTSQAAAPKSELPAALKGFKPIGTFYLSYQAGTQYTGVPDNTSDYNAFLLKRGYFGADVDLTSYLTARFVSDVTLDSAGDVKLRAKYLYGKFHWKGNKSISSPYMEFGLAHMPWLDFEEAMNGFRMQDTMFLERNNIFNSADVGVLFGSDFGGSLSSEYKSKVNSHYAGRYGSWQVGVYNGGGYHAKEQNTNKVFEGRVTIRPIAAALPGLQFTALGVVGKGNQPVTPPDWRGFNGMVSYESQYFTFTGQGYFGTGNQSGTAVLSDGTAADQKGFSIFAAVHIPTPKIGGKITILGRVDEFNTNTQVYNDIRRLYIAGVAWHFNKSNTWLFDYQRTNHSFSTIPGEDRAQLTLQLGF
jgi:hypothetical protein